MTKYEIHQRKNGFYYFILKAANGQVIVSSSDYASKAACHNGICFVQINGSTEKIEDETT